MRTPFKRQLTSNGKRKRRDLQEQQSKIMSHLDSELLVVQQCV